MIILMMMIVKAMLIMIMIHDVYAYGFLATLVATPTLAILIHGCMKYRKLLIPCTVGANGAEPKSRLLEIVVL